MCTCLQIKWTEGTAVLLCQTEQIRHVDVEQKRTDVTGEILLSQLHVKRCYWSCRLLVLVVWTASFLRIVFVRCSLSSPSSSLELLLTRLYCYTGSSEDGWDGDLVFSCDCRSCRDGLACVTAIAWFSRFAEGIFQERVSGDFVQNMFRAVDSEKVEHGKERTLRYSLGDLWTFGVAVRYWRSTRCCVSSGSSSVCCVIPVRRCTEMVLDRLSRWRTSERLDFFAEWTASGVLSGWWESFSPHKIVTDSTSRTSRKLHCGSQESMYFFVRSGRMDKSDLVYGRAEGGVTSGGETSSGGNASSSNCREGGTFCGGMRTGVDWTRWLVVIVVVRFGEGRRQEQILSQAHVNCLRAWTSEYYPLFQLWTLGSHSSALLGKQVA